MKKVKRWMKQWTRPACAALLAFVMAISPAFSSPALAAFGRKSLQKEYLEGLYERFEDYLDGFDSYTNLVDDSRYRCSRWANQANALTTELDYAIENAGEKSFWQKFKETSDKMDHNVVVELNIAATWAGHYLTDTKLDEKAYVEYLSRIVSMHDKGFLETAQAQADYTVRVNVGVELLDMLDTTVDTALKRNSIEALQVTVEDLCGKDAYKTLKEMFKDAKELKDKVGDLSAAFRTEVSNVQEAYSLAVYASLHQENIRFLQIICDHADETENRKLKNAAQTLIDASNLDMAGLILMDPAERLKNFSKIKCAYDGVPGIDDCVDFSISLATTSGAAMAAEAGLTRLASAISFLGSNASLIVAGFKIGGSLGRIFMGDRYESFREMLIMDEIAQVLSEALPACEEEYRKSRKDDGRYGAIYDLAAAGEALCYVRLRGEYTAYEYGKAEDDSLSDEELDQRYEHVVSRLGRYYEALDAVFPEPPKQVTVFADREYQKKAVADGFVIRDFAVPQIYIEGNEKATEKINESRALRDLRDIAEEDALNMEDALREAAVSGASASWIENYGSGALSASSSLWVKDAGVTKQAVSIMLMESSYYPMSAHPTSALIGYTFDMESGKQLALEDILETGDGSSAAEKEIREKFAAALTAGFLDYEYSGDLLQWGRRSAEEIVTGSFLELEESWRERHWYLSPEGFHMLFDVYQIGPYAAGNINVTVPWEKLSGIIKSEYMPDNLERLAAQGAPELLSYSNLGDKNKYDAEEHIYGDLSRSFWVGFTDAAAYEVKMECGNRMVFYANRMTPHDAVCLNDAEPETASPLDGGTVTYLWRQEGAADAQRVTVGFGKNE